MHPTQAMQHATRPHRGADAEPTIHIYIYIYVYVHVYIYIYIYMLYTRIYIIYVTNMRIYIYIYIYIYIIIMRVSATSLYRTGCRIAPGRPFFKDLPPGRDFRGENLR